MSQIQPDPELIADKIAKLNEHILQQEAYLERLMRRRNSLEELQGFIADGDKVYVDTSLLGMPDGSAYDMSPKPQPGRLVRITYEAVWARWDSIKRPITKPVLQPDTSQFLAPRNALVEIIPEER